MQEIRNLISAHPTIWQGIKLIFFAAVAIAAVTLLLRLEKKASKRLLAQKQNINLRFVESIVRFVLILLAVEWVVMSSPLTRPFGRVLFQGTAIIGAIAGFAAQPVIADIICGLMMSATRPFDIGDRIELEDGSSGIVKDITLRHVELIGLDTARLIYPNSRLNSMKITNMSRGGARSAIFKFSVAYDTDVDRAKAVILDAVAESPYSIPGKPGKGGVGYAPVYFMEYADSCLIMKTTVYYTPAHTTETVVDDVNSRVKRALNENGIEIPYNYLNVIMESKEQ